MPQIATSGIRITAGIGGNDTYQCCVSVVRWKADCGHMSSSSVSKQAQSLVPGGWLSITPSCPWSRLAAKCTKWLSLVGPAVRSPSIAT